MKTEDSPGGSWPYSLHKAGWLFSGCTMQMGSWCQHLASRSLRGRLHPSWMTGPVWSVADEMTGKLTALKSKYLVIRVYRQTSPHTLVWGCFSWLDPGFLGPEKWNHNVTEYSNVSNFQFAAAVWRRFSLVLTNWFSSLLWQNLTEIPPAGSQVWSELNLTNASGSAGYSSRLMPMASERPSIPRWV